MVCGLAQVESGEILWNNAPIASQHDSYRQDLCYLGHLNALQESMSVQENLMFTAALGGVALAESKARAVLERFGLRGRSQQLVRHLSQGQKRRVALSRLALSPARLWWQHTAGAAEALGLGGVVGNLVAGCEADFVRLDPQATPLLARKTAQAQDLDELLFALIVLGDDRLVHQTVTA